MHELLDNQVDIQNKNLRIKIPGFALVEITIEEKNDRHTNFLLKEGLYTMKAVSEDWLVQLWVINSTLNEGTNSLINKQIGTGLMFSWVVTQ